MAQIKLKMSIQDVQKTVKSKSNNLELLLSKAKDKKQISFLKSLITKEKKASDLIKKAELKKTASIYKMSVNEYLTFRAKAKELLNDFHTGHSMGCYRNLGINVNGKLLSFTSNHKLDTYAKSCTWKPTYGYIDINLTKKQLQAIENIEGIWTIKLAENKAIWLEQEGTKTHHKVKFVEGYCVGRSHGSTLEEATRLENKKIATQINLMQDNRRFVSAEIVHKETGACMNGINAFCQRVGLNIDYGYNLGYLKSLNDRIANTYLSRIS